MSTNEKRRDPALGHGAHIGNVIDVHTASVGNSQPQTRREAGPTPQTC